MKLLLSIPILVIALVALPLHAEDKKQAIVDINAKQAQELLATNKSVVVLDVRTPQEFSAGHITGATNLDFHGPDFDRQLAKMDRKQTYLVHCATGRRSAATRDKMDGLNYKSVYHLDGGFKGWEKAGNKVEK